MKDRIPPCAHSMPARPEHLRVVQCMVFSSFSSFLQPALYLKPHVLTREKLQPSVHSSYIGLSRLVLSHTCLFSSMYLNLLRWRCLASWC